MRSISPAARPARISAPLLAALAAGEDGDPHAGGLGELLDGGEVLPRQNFGRRHQRGLPAGLDHGRGGQQRDHGLAGADIALQQPQHPVRLGEIGDDVGHGAGLRRGQRVGQRFDDALAQPAFRRAAVAGALAHLRANQRQRQLAGEQFVIGKPRPGRSGRLQIVRRLWPMDGMQRGGEIRIILAGEPGRILPFRQLRDALERAVHRLAHAERMQPFGQRIDRIEQRQLGEAFCGRRRGRDAPSADGRRRAWSTPET